MRIIRSTKKDGTERMMAVDNFFKKNYRVFEHEEGLPPQGRFQRMDEGDYDAVYGIDDYPMLGLYAEVRAEMNRNPDSIVILYECPHSGDKQRHHPDFAKPFETELLCERCRYAIINKYNSFNKFRFGEFPNSKSFIPDTPPAATMIPRATERGQ